MKDITQDFGTLYRPVSALVFYEAEGSNSDVYVEYFDMDKNGNPVNAHPLSVREADRLAKSLHTEKEKEFLKSEGILPANVLHINPCENGAVLWFTKRRKTKMYFTDSLGIPNGTAEIPALLWYADRQSLTLYAFASDRRPTETTELCHAPFFNVYEAGNVCMGTVNVHIKDSASVEEFMQAWETYFFESYFSHLINGHNPVNGNCVSLWEKLVGTEKAFPKEALKKANRKLKNLLR